MADGFRIDLRKLGEKLPGGVQRAGRRLAKAAEKPVALAHEAAFPLDSLDEPLERALHPAVAERLRDCTIETRAHVEGIADLPGIQHEHGSVQPVTLFRLRVERPEGEAETCVRQFLPGAFRKLLPGSSVRALAHARDSSFAVLDWARTAERMGFELDGGSGPLEQYAWPERESWPAKGAIEIRDTRRRMRGLEERRASWGRADGRLLGASSRGSNHDGRQLWTLELELAGRRVKVKERVPRLLIGRVIGFRESGSHLGGLVESYDVVVDDRARIPLLVSPDDEIAVDWQALIDQPEMTSPG
jgi:hypothetical protein